VRPTLTESHRVPAVAHFGTSSTSTATTSRDRPRRHAGSKTWQAPVRPYGVLVTLGRSGGEGGAAPNLDSLTSLGMYRFSSLCPRVSTVVIHRIWYSGELTTPYQGVVIVLRSPLLSLSLPARPVDCCVSSIRRDCQGGRPERTRRTSQVNRDTAVRVISSVGHWPFCRPRGLGRVLKASARWQAERWRAAAGRSCPPEGFCSGDMRSKAASRAAVDHPGHSHTM